MMGGVLKVESESGKGSSFSFELPFAISSSKLNQSTVAQDLNYQSLGNRYVLVAEDVELNQYLVRHIMESWGFTVDVVNNGREAVAMVEKNKYDLVLMDIQMPEMDGIEATGAIRQLSDPVKAAIPIIALTANALKGDSEKYLAAGMNDFLPKPFNEQKLFIVISNNLKTGAGAPKPMNKSKARTNSSRACKRNYRNRSARLLCLIRDRRDAGRGYAALPACSSRGSAPGPCS